MEADSTNYFVFLLLFGIFLIVVIILLFYFCYNYRMRQRQLLVRWASAASRQRRNGPTNAQNNTAYLSSVKRQVPQNLKSAPWKQRTSFYRELMKSYEHANATIDRQSV